jgi:hypothetical protein
MKIGFDLARMGDWGRWSLPSPIPIPYYFLILISQII